MKKLFILASLLLAPVITQAAMPCQWQSNYGYIKFLSPVPTWNSVRIGLTGGQTLMDIYQAIHDGMKVGHLIRGRVR